MVIQIQFLAGRDSRLEMDKAQLKSFINWLEDDKGKNCYLYEKEGYYEYIFKHAIVKVTSSDY